MAFPESLGTDFDCADDITEDWAYQPDPKVAFIQAMYRRLVMARLFYSEDYGLGFFRFSLESDLTLAQVKDAITLELLKDERVLDVNVTALNTVIRVKVTPHDAPDQPLTLSIDRVKGVLIEGSQS